MSILQTWRTGYPEYILLSSQFWPIPSMSRGVINSVKQRLSPLLSRIQSIDQWAVNQDPFLTLTTSAKIGKTAIPLKVWAVGIHVYVSRGCAYSIWLEFRSGMSVNVCLREVCCCQAADVVTAPHRRMLPRVCLGRAPRALLRGAVNALLGRC